MKILVMGDKRYEDKINPLVEDIKTIEPETRFHPLERDKIEIPYLEVLIFIAKTVEHAMVAKLLERGVEWALKAVEGKKFPSQRSTFVTIFGKDGIPIVGKHVFSTGEVQDV